MTTSPVDPADTRKQRRRRWWDEFQLACYEIAREHGFHEADAGQHGYGPAPVAEVARRDDQVERRLMLIVGEVAEAHEVVHRGTLRLSEITREGGKPEGLPIEMADIVIRVADFCATYGINLGDAIEEKMAFNRGRPKLHGKKF